MSKPKYTKEMEEALELAYTREETEEGRDKVINEFVALWGKTRQMIIAKLSNMKDEEGNSIYKTKLRVSKLSGAKPETKEQLVARIEGKFGYIMGDLEGLEKAPKTVLLKLLKEWKSVYSLQSGVKN